MRPATELWAQSAEELRAGYATRAFSPPEVIDALSRRIERLSPSLGAFTTLCLERAQEEAQVADRRLARDVDTGVLAGVPFAAKDMFDSAGVRTTYGSRIFAAHVPDRDAAGVAAVRAADGILVGKTQTHEFAWGSHRSTRRPGQREIRGIPSASPADRARGRAMARAATLQWCRRART